MGLANLNQERITLDELINRAIEALQKAQTDEGECMHIWKQDMWER